MNGQPPLNLDLAPLPSAAVVADIVYVPAETALLAAARARGLRTVGGLGMLLHQAVPGFERWFGVRPQVDGELRRLLEAMLDEQEFLSPFGIRSMSRVHHDTPYQVDIGVAEFDDGLTITPGPLHGARVETYNDHRMAMSMSLIGLRVPGVRIHNPGCVAKTYPTFFDDLERLR